jgi:heat shock protein HtpX
MLRRALLALGLMTGFYTLAIAIVVALVALPVAEIVYAHRVTPKLALVCLGAAITVLWAVVPRRDRFVPPGPELPAAQYPDLHALVREVASATGQQMPADIYLVGDVNAWVAHRGGLMGIGSRRVMGLGLPLMQGVTEDELRAVLAHEFGHYSSGDVALGPWLYKTRAAIGRTIAGLGDGYIAKIFNAYGRVFLRLTHAVSRQQEFIADAIAARVSGAGTMVSALRRTHALAVAHALYWQEEVTPVLRAGYRPRLAEGFARYFAAERVAAVCRDAVAQDEAGAEAGEFDTHPPLADRVEALEGQTGSWRNPSTVRHAFASSLLGDCEPLANSLFDRLVGPEQARALACLEWSAVAERVYATRWREMIRAYPDVARSIVPADLVPGPSAFAAIGSRLVGDSEIGIDEAQRVARAVGMITAVIGASLIDRGWQITTAPGAPVLLTSEGDTVDVARQVDALARGRIDDAEWAAWARRYAA